MNTRVVEVVQLVDTNKARIAFLAPVIASILAAAASWVVTGNFSDTEIRTAISGVLLGGASGVGTFLTGAGRAEVKV